MIGGGATAVNRIRIMFVAKGTAIFSVAFTKVLGALKLRALKSRLMP